MQTTASDTATSLGNDWSDTFACRLYPLTDKHIFLRPLLVTTEPSLATVDHGCLLAGSGFISAVLHLDGTVYYYLFPRLHLGIASNSSRQANGDVIPVRDSLDCIFATLR